MREIPLTKGYVAFVDDEDFDRVAQFKWTATITSRGTKVYAVRKTRKHEKERWKSQKIRLHHWVLDIAPSELPPGYVVDHFNDNGLDCRKTINERSQLQIITQEANMAKVPTWRANKKVECFL
jgi:hypothetical protein